MVIILATCSVKTVGSKKYGSSGGGIHCPRKLSSDFHMSTPLLSHTLCWLIFVNCKQTRNTWEGGTSTEELPRPDWPMGESMGHFLNC